MGQTENIQENILVSVIVPVYRTGEKLLRDAAESVLRQDMDALELILVDDGSTTADAAACDAYAGQDARVRVCHTANRGVSAARNLGLQMARGKYVFFLDADDMITSDALSALTEVAGEEQAEAVICGAMKTRVPGRGAAGRHVFRRQDGDVKLLTGRKALDALCYAREIFPGFEVGSIWGLFERGVIQEIPFNETMTIGEDNEWKSRIFPACTRIACVDRPYYVYRRRSTSASRAIDAGGIAGSLACIRNMAASETEESAPLQCLAVNIAFIMLLRMKDSPEAEERCAELEDFIRSCRRDVLMNGHARLKVRLALLLSYTGFGTIRFVYGLPEYRRKLKRRVGTVLARAGA